MKGQIKDTLVVKKIKSHSDIFNSTSGTHISFADCVCYSERNSLTKPIQIGNKEKTIYCSFLEFDGN